MRDLGLERGIKHAETSGGKETKHIVAQLQTYVVKLTEHTESFFLLPP